MPVANTLNHEGVFCYGLIVGQATETSFELSYDSTCIIVSDCQWVQLGTNLRPLVIREVKTTTIDNEEVRFASLELLGYLNEDEVEVVLDILQLIGFQGTLVIRFICLEVNVEGKT